MGNIEGFGDPDIQISGLKIWVHGRESPDRGDFWDGNWLRATVRCHSDGAEVVVSGSILHLSEIQSWFEDLQRMMSTLSGTACLDCMEPELKVEMKAESLGQISTTVKITPNNLTQFHSFEFETDQSYLPALITDLKKVLGIYPIKGTP